MERYIIREDWTHLAAPLSTDRAGELADHIAGADAPPPAPPLAHCGLCGSAHVLVIGLAWNMDHRTGDAHYGYEVMCEECHRFSAFAHVETATECDALWAQARTAQVHRRTLKHTLLARIAARFTGHEIH